MGFHIFKDIPVKGMLLLSHQLIQDAGTKLIVSSNFFKKYPDASKSLLNMYDSKINYVNPGQLITYSHLINNKGAWQEMGY